MRGGPKRQKHLPANWPRGARASTDSISRFYASHLTAETNVERLLPNDAAKSIDQGSNLEDRLAGTQ
jgi:hypothetical protein